jgi:hypothetical protein
LRQNGALRRKKGSLPLGIFILFSFEFVQLLVEESNRYYNQYLGTIDEGCSPLPDMTILEM